MDDRFAYILNSLWTKHWDLGRIVRFRKVTRGRQAKCFEILTGEQREFCASLFPPAFELPELNRMAAGLALLEQQRFSVRPLIPARDQSCAVPGPDSTRMTVSLNLPGRYSLPDEWSPLDLTQLGLRLAWLHRALAEQLPVDNPPRLAALLQEALESPREVRRLEALQTALPTLVDALDRLEANLEDLPPPTAWVHGDLQPAAVLLDDDRQICGLVDWALIHPGDPLEDLIDAFVHWCLGQDGVANPQAGRALIESYRSLHDFAPQPWSQAVTHWTARRLIDALANRRPLPRGFAQYLADPARITLPLESCETK